METYAEILKELVKTMSRNSYTPIQTRPFDRLLEEVAAVLRCKSAFKTSRNDARLELKDDGKFTLALKLLAGIPIRGEGRTIRINYEQIREDIIGELVNRPLDAEEVRKAVELACARLDKMKTDYNEFIERKKVILRQLPTQGTEYEFGEYYYDKHSHYGTDSLSTVFPDKSPAGESMRELTGIVSLYHQVHYLKND